MKNKILVVDDEKNMLYSLEKLLSSDACEVFTAQNGKEAIKRIKKVTPKLVLMDIQMPEMDGLETFKEIRKLNPKQTVIMMTGYGTTETAINAMKMGAYDYITKPFDVPQIKKVINSALEATNLMDETVSIKENKDVDLQSRSIIGISAPMQEIYKTIGQIANSNVAALILGDSGTGKELIARAIYHYSSRSKEKFMALNCAAIPENLLESELFGYEKGSFTGALDRRIGRFEQVSGGTLFLDEIGDMPLGLQSKLLRVLQEGQIERIGGSETIPVDVRIISASNRDLKKEIEKKNFREDLFYRLNVVTIKLPNLKERKQDIPDLVEYFVARFNLEFNKQIKEIPKKLLDQLINNPWPGNVRQLENVIKRAVVMSSGSGLKIEDENLEFADQQITDIKGGEKKVSLENFDIFFQQNLEQLFHQLSLLPEDHPYREDLLAKIEKVLIDLSLKFFNGNQVKTAKLLGITRNTLRSRLGQ